MSNEPLARAMGVEPDSLNFEASVIPTRLADAALQDRLARDESEIITYAVDAWERFRGVASQVTITAWPSPYQHGLFAIRHLSDAGDSGWTVWQDGAYVGTLQDIEGA